jgi:hypothetical protein
MSGPSNEIAAYFSSLPHWILAVSVIAAVIVGIGINDRIVRWHRSRFPWMFKPKVLLVTFALGVMVIAFGLWINPPSKVREDFQQAHPELFLKPANPPAIQR